MSSALWSYPIAIATGPRPTVIGVPGVPVAVAIGCAWVPA
jgi:hypothetical protein